MKTVKKRGGEIPEKKNAHKLKSNAGDEIKEKLKQIIKNRKFLMREQKIQKLIKM